MSYALAHRNDCNGSTALESFHRFFERWLLEQNKDLQHLISASKQHIRTKTNPTNAAESTRTDETRGADKPDLRRLIDQVVQHYEQYYQAKSRYAKQDVLGVLTPPWSSALEEAFMWIGGWRPSTGFHLLYSKSGLQFEEQLDSLIKGWGNGDLGDLSSSQLRQVDELQRRTIREEREISEQMAMHQESVADTSMVELSHAVTELMRSEEAGRAGGGGVVDEGRVESALALKEEGLEKILRRADDLRLRTLKSLLDIFTPIQAVHFLIAAAELHLRFHDWGQKKSTNQDLHVTGGN